MSRILILLDDSLSMVGIFPKTKTVGVKFEQNSVILINVEKRVEFCVRYFQPDFSARHFLCS